MEAADESKRQGGKPVTLESVMTKARAHAWQVKGCLAQPPLRFFGLGRFGRAGAGWG